MPHIATTKPHVLPGVALLTAAGILTLAGCSGSTSVQIGDPIREDEKPFVRQVQTASELVGTYTDQQIVDSARDICERLSSGDTAEAHMQRIFEDPDHQGWAQPGDASLTLDAALDGLCTVDNI